MRNGSRPAMPATAIDWPAALGWRMDRQLLDPVGTESVAGVVDRLGAVPAFPEASADLAVRIRQQRSRPGAMAAALADGEIIKTFAFRGATHLLTPKLGSAYLALRASRRMWELPSWRSYYGLEPSDWPDLRAAVREALADGPMTPEELAAAVTRTPRFRALAFAFTTPSKTFLKPFAWLGDLSFGPARDGHWTLRRLADNPHWEGLPDLDIAGPIAIEAYFRAYGPATPEHIHYWLGLGLGTTRKRIAAWITGLGQRLAPVSVDGQPHLVVRDDLAALLGAPPATAVRFLPAYDQWVLGPGTNDAHVVPSARRALVSRGANLVIAGGVVCGTWSFKEDRIDVDWFAEAGDPPGPALEEAAGRLAAIVGRPGGSVTLAVVRAA